MSRDNASRRTVRVNAPKQKHGDADRHIRTAEFRRYGICKRNADKIGADRERKRDEQSRWNVQYLVDFSARVDLGRRGSAQ